MMFKRAIFLAVLLFCNLSYGETVSENSIKAAFIFHFINFTQWDDNETEYDVCIPDDKPLLETARQTLGDKIVNNRKIVVVERTENCHVLVANNDMPSNSSMLTIGTLDKGALMEFRIVKNKLRFAINLNKIKNSRLKISSQLLKLAILE